jgi:hypothetical protein
MRRERVPREVSRRVDSFQMSTPHSTSCAGFSVEAWKKHHGQRRCGFRADGLQEEWNQVPMIFGELATFCPCLMPGDGRIDSPNDSRSIGSRAVTARVVADPLTAAWLEGNAWATADNVLIASSTCDFQIGEVLVGNSYVKSKHGAD